MISRFFGFGPKQIQPPVSGDSQSSPRIQNQPSPPNIPVPQGAVSAEPQPLENKVSRENSLSSHWTSSIETSNLGNNFSPNAIVPIDNPLKPGQTLLLLNALQSKSADDPSLPPSRANRSIKEIWISRIEAQCANIQAATKDSSSITIAIPAHSTGPKNMDLNLFTRTILEYFAKQGPLLAEKNIRFEFHSGDLATSQAWQSALASVNDPALKSHFVVCNEREIQNSQANFILCPLRGDGNRLTLDNMNKSVGAAKAILGNIVQQLGEEPRSANIAAVANHVLSSEPIAFPATPPDLQLAHRTPAALAPSTPSSSSSALAAAEPNKSPLTITEALAIVKNRIDAFKNHPDCFPTLQLSHEDRVYLVSNSNTLEGPWLGENIEFNPGNPTSLADQGKRNSYRYHFPSETWSVRVKHLDFRHDKTIPNLPELNSEGKAVIQDLLNQLVEATKTPLEPVQLVDIEQYKKQLSDDCPWYQDPSPTPPESLLTQLAGTAPEFSSSAASSSTHRLSNGESPSNIEISTSSAQIQPFNPDRKKLEDIYFLRSSTQRQVARKELHQVLFQGIIQSGKPQPIDLSDLLVGFKGEPLAIYVDQNQNLVITGTPRNEDPWMIAIDPEGKIQNEDSTNFKVATSIVNALFLKKDDIASYLSNPLEYNRRLCNSVSKVIDFAMSIQNVRGARHKQIENTASQESSSSASSAVASASPMASAASSDQNNYLEEWSLDNIITPVISNDSQLLIKVIKSQKETTLEIGKYSVGGRGIAGSAAGRAVKLSINNVNNELEIQIHKSSSDRVGGDYSTKHNYRLQLSEDGIQLTQIAASGQRISPKEVEDDLKYLRCTLVTWGDAVSNPLTMYVNKSDTVAFPLRALSKPLWKYDCRFLNNGRVVPDQLFMAMEKYGVQDVVGGATQTSFLVNLHLPERANPQQLVPRRRG